MADTIATNRTDLDSQIIAASTVRGNGSEDDTITINPSITLASDLSIAGSPTSGSLTISGNLDGGSAINVTGFTGGPTLTLTGNNTFTGGLTVTASRVVELDTGNALGRGTVNIGTGATVELAVSAAVSANGAVLQAPGTFTGTGTLAKTGTGSLVFGGGGNTFISLSKGGLIDLQQGVLAGSAADQGIWRDNQASLNIEAGASFNTVEAAVFVDALTGGGTYAGGFQGTRTTTIGVADGSGTFSGTLGDNVNTGGLRIVKAGTGTQILTGENTYTGGTTINGGTLQIGNGGMTGSIVGNVVDNGALVFNRSDAVSFGGIVSGTGSLSQSGTGSLTLTGANTYTGGTSIVAGTLIATPGSVGSGAITINGGTFGNAGNGGAVQNFGNAIVIGASGGAIQGQGLVLQLDGAISGSGALAFTQGDVRLSGDNSGFSGATTLQGNVTLGAESGTAFSSSSAFRIASGSTLNTGTYNHTLGSLSDVAGSGGGTVANLSGSAVTLSVGSDGTSTTFSGVIQNSVSALGLTKIGLGTLTLAGANTYTGATTINAGTLQLGAGGSTGSLATASAITIGTNGTLAVNHSDLLTLGNSITGSGALQQNGTGGLKLTAANTGFTGPVALTAGTLELGQINSAGTGAITFAAGAQKLQIDVTGTLGNTLTTVGTSDQIDFQALNFTGAFKTYDAATRTLSVTNGVSTSSVRFDAGSTLTSNQLVLSTDADGSAVITVRDALTAAPTGTPGGGPVTVFTGAQSVTVAKADTLVLAVDPGAFTGASEQNGNVVLAIAGKTATITGAQLTSDGIPGVSLVGGDILVGQNGFSITSTKANSILIGGTGGEINNVVDPGQTVGTHVIFGGVGIADPSDGADSITFGGKGAWGVYGNAGADGIVQGASVFDSTSFVSVFGGKDGDSITLANNGNLNAHFAIYGSENGPAGAANAGIDSITVYNTGSNASTIIFGGQGAADPTDGADTIIFNGGGSVAIFGNAGDDRITLGATGGLDATTNAVVHGGIGNDTIVATFAAGTKATTQVYGDEGSDTITVTNAGGNTTIFGGTGTADASDQADSITINGSGGTITVFSNSGGDTVIGTGLQDSTTATIYGGRGNDSITLTNASASGKSSLIIYGGEDEDQISANANGGSLTIYGGTSQSDAADGADTITLTGTNTGTVLVIANGGADVVNVGATGTDSATIVQVFGGGGNDSINVVAQANGAQKLSLSGNDGMDSFTIAKGTGQTITITDFAVGTGGDKLSITGVGNAGIQATTGSFQILQQALDAASTQAGAGKAASVTFDGSSYVVLETAGNGTFDIGTDQAIKLTGLTDLNGLIAATTIA